MVEGGRRWGGWGYSRKYQSSRVSGAHCGEEVEKVVEAEEVEEVEEAKEVEKVGEERFS